MIRKRPTVTAFNYVVVYMKKTIMYNSCTQLCILVSKNTKLNIHEITKSSKQEKLQMFNDIHDKYAETHICMYVHMYIYL